MDEEKVQTSTRYFLFHRTRIPEAKNIQGGESLKEEVMFLASKDRIVGLDG